MSLILQRYYFFCKSQPGNQCLKSWTRCLWYYKGTIFFANHNSDEIEEKQLEMSLILQRYYFFCKSQRVFLWLLWRLDVFDITKVLFFLQITTISCAFACWRGCLWYYKGTIFFANHNKELWRKCKFVMSLILQRYYFFCKSQLPQSVDAIVERCLWYYKGTIFFANHNHFSVFLKSSQDVFDITKVLFFLQITTIITKLMFKKSMSLILQRYYFFCKSQLGG